VTSTQIVILGKKVTFSELCAQVRGEHEVSNNYTEDVPNDRYSPLAYALPLRKKEESRRNRQDRRVRRKVDLIDRITPKQSNVVVNAKRVQNNKLQSSRISESFVKEKKKKKEKQLGICKTDSGVDLKPRLGAYY